MNARVARELYAEHFGDGELNGASLRVPDVVQPDAQHSRVEPAAGRPQANNKDDLMTTKLQWTPAPVPDLNRALAVANCSVFGLFWAELAELEITPDDLATDFQAFISDMVHTQLKDIPEGSPLANLVKQAEAFGKDADAKLSHTVQFVVRVDGNRLFQDFVRSWPVVDTFDFGRPKAVLVDEPGLAPPSEPTIETTPVVLTPEPVVPVVPPTETTPVVGGAVELTPKAVHTDAPPVVSPELPEAK